MSSNLHYYHKDWIEPTDVVLKADLAVYGGSSAGVIAAVAAARQGLNVVLLQPGKHLGGLTSGGLGWTDYGRKHVIGGMARQFYQQIGAHYGKEEEWHFEPHPAEKLFDTMARQHGFIVSFAQYLESVVMQGQRIVEATLRSGMKVRAKYWIDASYEGDLLAQAGVAYHVGRESNEVYGESLNGIQILHTHQFSHAVDPYVREGDPRSGLLPLIEQVDLSRHKGRGDHRVQAYNFRVCMTNDPALKIDWQQPTDYQADWYVLASRWFNGEKDGMNEHLPHLTGDYQFIPRKFDVFFNKTPGGYQKTDTNNHGPVSSDFIGANWQWPCASYEERERIFQQHVSYQQGFYWFMANDPSIPSRYRDAYRHWGLARDEFTDTNHWPHQLYVREARRMIADYVITERDCMGTCRPDDPVGMGSYTLDSHNCTRFVTIDQGKARVINEGCVEVPPTDPYPISYRAIVPARGQCENLIVPICFSASHIAYGSARMEPVFMVLGESAALAISLALRLGCPVQDVPYHQLRPMLEKAEQVLELPSFGLEK